ncbi:MAG TPA: alkaline phosphatase family protein [Kofleriaceae bacterium]
MHLPSVVAIIALLAGCHPKRLEKVGELELHGEHVELRKRAKGSPPNDPDTPAMLVLALDGVSRQLLYDMLHRGELPNLAMLLGGEHFDHAYFDHSLLSTLPSTTMAAWATAFTGVPPGQHGVTGNEYFVRETRTFVCPAPVSFADATPTLEIYTDDSLGKVIDAPTVYERLREQAPDALVWVAMNHVYRGADLLLLARRTAIVGAIDGYLESFAAEHLTDSSSRKLYENLDNSALGSVLARLDKGPVPDVLTFYVSGTDLYAHTAKEGPDPARRTYLAEVVEPAIGQLLDKLRARDAGANRWIIVTADHGHTEVIKDRQHALATAPADVLRGAGFRPRPFKRTVDKSDPFSAVLAYGGAMAYVYLADRSKCPGDHDVCAWDQPPRYAEDVLAAAEAFARANAGDPAVPAMTGTLDMILVRRPRPVSDIDLPFEVYVGGGRTVAIDDYLAGHPHPSYVAFAARMHDLAVGPHGEHAGDLLLLAHNGDRSDPEQRFYFASPYRSWHGSPSRADSELPFIVAHPMLRAAAIGARVRRVLGGRPFQQKVTDVILELRRSPAPRPAEAH